MDIVISEPGRRSNPLLKRVTLVQGDITQQKVDAIVALVPQSLEYRGEINKAILAAAGEKLDEFVLEHIYKPRPGDVYAVPGFNMPCEHILYSITPNWRADFEREDRHLLTCCRKALVMARSMSLSSVAIPPLASGRHGFPNARAARLIVQAIEDRLDENFEEIRIVCPDAESVETFRQRLQSVGWEGSTTP